MESSVDCMKSWILRKGAEINKKQCFYTLPIKLKNKLPRGGGGGALIKVHEKNDLGPDLEGVWLDKRGRVRQFA